MFVVCTGLVYTPLSRYRWGPSEEPDGWDDFENVDAGTFAVSSENLSEVKRKGMS